MSENKKEERLKGLNELLISFNSKFGKDLEHSQNYYRNELSLLLELGVKVEAISELYRKKFLSFHELNLVRICVLEEIEFETILTYFKNRIMNIESILAFRRDYQEKKIHKKVLKITETGESKPEKVEKGQEFEVQNTIDTYYKHIEFLIKQVNAQMEHTRTICESVIASADTKADSQIAYLQNIIAKKDCELKNRDTRLISLYAKLEEVKHTSYNKTDVQGYLFDKSQEDKGEKKIERIETKETQRFFKNWSGRAKKKERHEKEIKDQFIKFITDPTISVEVTKELELAYKDGLSLSDIKKIGQSSHEKAKVRQNRIFVTQLRGLPVTKTLPETDLSIEAQQQQQSSVAAAAVQQEESETFVEEIDEEFFGSLDD